MKHLLLAIVLATGIAAPLAAQTVEKPEPLHEGSFIYPGHVYPDGYLDSMPSNMVLGPGKDDGKDIWVMCRINSCWACGPAMTFKQAALDKQSSFAWLAVVGLAVADTEITESILHNHPNLSEGNPLLGNSRKVQYGIRLPIIFGAWMGTSYIRKGNKEFHIGGVRRWWTLPLIYAGMSTTGIIVNLARGK